MAAGPPRVGRIVPRPARRWVANLGFRRMRQITVVVMLAATAAFGGLDSVDTKATPIKAGEPFDDGEFTITIQKASAVDELRAGNSVLRPAIPDRRYLGIVAKVRNNGTIPGRLQDEIDLREQPDKEFIGVFRYADSSLLQTLGPALTETLVFVWQLPQSALQPGSTVSLRVWRKQFRELTVSYGKDWIDRDRYGEIQLPVKMVT